MKLKFLSLLLVIFNIFSCVTYAEDDSSLNVTKTSDSIEIDSDAQSNDNIQSSAQPIINSAGTGQNEVIVSSAEQNETKDVSQKDNEEENETKKILKDIWYQMKSFASTLSDYKIKSATIGSLHAKRFESVSVQNRFIKFLDEFFDRCISIVNDNPDKITYAGSKLYVNSIECTRSNAVESGETSEYLGFRVIIYDKCMQFSRMSKFGYENDVLWIVITDGKYIVDYMNNLYDSGLSGFEKEKTSDIHTTIDKLDKKTDEVVFDFIVPENFKGDFTETIADVGETVSSCFEHYILGTSTDYYFLKLKGSKGEITLWNQAAGGGFLKIPSSHIPMNFLFGHYVDNGTLLTQNKSRDFVDEIKFQILFSGNEVSSIKIGCSVPYIGEGYEQLCRDPIIMYYRKTATYPSYQTVMEKAAIGRNIEYTVFEDNNNNLSESHKEISREEYIASLNFAETEQQDLERYVTMLKGKTDKGREFTYKINFLAEVPLYNNSETAPAWYKKLGDEVKVTIMSYTLIRDGKSFNLEEFMMRFKGSKGEEWFEYVELTDEQSNSKSKTKTMAYDSLISFDGSIKVKNTIEHETISAKMEFENNDRDDLKSISINIGTASINADIDEFKYIGGGKIVYDKIW